MGRGHSPSPGGEGDTPSPHPTPLGAFGASILAPLAILDPRVSAPRFSAYGGDTRHFSETTLSTDSKWGLTMSWRAQKCQNLCSKCAPYTDTSAYRRRRVSRVSLSSPGKQRCCALDALGRCPIETLKIVSRQPSNVWQWLLNKKVAATIICHLLFYTKFEQSGCNKSSTG